FVAAMVCHGELARTRPQAKHLTGFYLCMSIGGVLGGLFNTVLAPLAFNTLLEYPLMIVAACLLMPKLGLNPQNTLTPFVDSIVPACVFAFGLATGFIILSRDPEIHKILYRESARLPAEWTERSRGWLKDPRERDEDPILHMERGFFGVVRVREYGAVIGVREREGWQGLYHYLQHGNINHGMQRVYFSPEGDAAIYAPLAACTEPFDAMIAAATRRQAARERRHDEPIAY